MNVRMLASLVSLTLLTTPAFAEDAPEKPRVQRRAEKHSRDRSAAVKNKSGGRVLEIDTVVVTGRPGKPMASVDTSIQKFKFPVGTARYSESDQRFVKSARDSSW